MRLSFTSKEETVNETATFEPANQNTEQSQFVRYSTAKLVNTALFDRTNGAANGYAQRLNGSANERYGLAKSISVMPGDVVQAEVYAKYVDPVSSNWNGALAALMTQIAGGAAGVVVDGSAYATSTGSFPFAGLLSTNDTGAPRAYLNWLVFDRNYGFITGGFLRSGVSRHGDSAYIFAWDQINGGEQPMGNATKLPHDFMSQEYTAREEGYIFVYLSNENLTQVDVYFDDVVFTHTPGNLLQYNEYYPFGLQTANSWTRENTTGNNFLGNAGTEFNTTSQWYDLDFRNYDPALGRLHGVDPMAAKYSSLTPYNYSFNDPVSFSDPSGADPWDNGPYGGSAAYYYALNFGYASPGREAIMDPGNPGFNIDPTYWNPATAGGYGVSVGQYLSTINFSSGFSRGATIDIDLSGYPQTGLLSFNLMTGKVNHFSDAEVDAARNMFSSMLGIGEYQPDPIRLMIGDEAGTYFQNLSAQVSGATQVIRYVSSANARGSIFHGGGKQSQGNCPTCLDPSTVGRNPFGLSYPGPWNPMTFPDENGNRRPDYTTIPKSLAEYPAIGHDRRYDNLKIAGFWGLVSDTRAIGADWRFVKEEFSIALTPYFDPVTKAQAAFFGTVLGVAALIKTVIGFSTPQSSANVIMWYHISNIGVTNSPGK